MSQPKNDNLLCAIVGGVVGFFLSCICWVGWMGERIYEEHQKAIEADVGRWAIDELTGEKEFVYGVKDE